MVLTDHVGSADPTSLYERIRASVADHPFATPVGELSITISFGVSVWNKDDTGDDLLAAADEALYRAKRAGRNRVVLARQSRVS